jgi:hypothetical protein
VSDTKTTLTRRGRKPAATTVDPIEQGKADARAAAAKAVAGVTKTEPTKPAAAKVPARTKSSPKTTTASTKAASEPKAGSNGSKLAHKQDLAKQVVDLVTSHFKGLSPEDQARVAYWIRYCPTKPDEQGHRYWPADFARPTTAGWE